MRKTLLIAAIFSLTLLIGSLAPAKSADASTTWNIGDVFAGRNTGEYNVYDNAGVFKETINQGLGYAGTGCSFNGARDRLYTTNFSNDEVVVFDNADPHAIVDSIDTAAQGGSHSESVVFAANGDFYVGHADGAEDIQRFNAAGVFQQQYNVATTARGSDWVELASDQTTMFYTSEGTEVFRYDLVADAQLPNFATAIPGITHTFALRLLPPGDASAGLLVAAWPDIKRLDSTGAVVQSYDVGGENNWFALNLDPNGTSFWSADVFTGNIYRFDIATGAVEVGPINNGGETDGLCVKGEPTAGNPTDDCPTCDQTTITVDEDVTVDLNPAVPTCNDGLTNDLCDYFSFSKTGSDASKWKAIFNVGASRVIIKDNATVTTVTVPAAGANRKAPGIEIIGSCELFIEGDLDNNGEPGGIVVTSYNQPAGDILVKFDGHIDIDGRVINQVIGTLGFPGKITIASCCGNITTGPRSRIETIGVDPGGSDINILACCDRGYGGTGGDILIQGMVHAIHKQGKTPTINIVAFEGGITIVGTNDFGEETVAGTKIRRTSGVLVETTGVTSAGDINIQAQDAVNVIGNTILNKNRIQYGAVAIKSKNTNGQGGDGDMNVISTNGGIRAIDRAFDFENRFNALNAITLLSLNDITLAVSGSVNNGAADNSKAVVSSQGGANGKGGTNTLQSYCGAINILLKAQVLANAPGGTPGTNLLIASTGVNNAGTVNPADANNADDVGPCNEFGPRPIFTSCEDFGVVCGDSIIDADGFASPLSGDPAAREVVEGDPLTNFGTVTGARCGLDMFDRDGNGDWSDGDDLHCESDQCQAVDNSPARHGPGDCVVLDINGNLAFGEPVNCDLDLNFPDPSGGAPGSVCPTNIKYHDANSNGQYDNGEDIVLDDNLDGIFN